MTTFWFLLDHFVVLADPVLFQYKPLPAYFVYKFFSNFLGEEANQNQNTKEGGAEVSSRTDFVDGLVAALYYTIQVCWIVALFVYGYRCGV